MNVRRESGLEAKNHKLSAMAQFQAHHVPWLLSEMGALGGVMWMRYWRWQGLAFDNERRSRQ